MSKLGLHLFINKVLTVRHSVFILYGIPAAASGVAAVVLRIVIFYFPLILGYLFIQAIGARKVLTSDAMKEVETEQQ